MKISIVTVAYNSATTIADTLASVASQSSTSVEHIVVDGASRDDTLAVVRTLGMHVSRLISEPDDGIYDAMNKGVAAATGDLVGFLNADDVLASAEAMSRLRQIALETGADGFYADLQYVRADDLASVVRHWRAGRFSHRALQLGWMPAHPTFYVRRSDFLALGGFDTSLRIAADYDFMLRFLSRPGVRVRYVPQVMVKMRIGGASNRSLNAIWRKSQEDLQALQRSGVGGLGTLVCKNLRKLPQFLLRGATPA